MSNKALSRKLIEVRLLIVKFFILATYDISRTKSFMAYMETSEWAWLMLPSFWSCGTMSCSSVESNQDIFVTLARSMITILSTYWFKEGPLAAKKFKI